MPVQDEQRAVRERQRQDEHDRAAHVMADEVGAAAHAEREPPVRGGVADRRQRQRDRVRAARADQARAAAGTAARSASVLTTPTPMNRATGEAAIRRATPSRSSIAVRTIRTRESGSSIQSTGTSWIRSPRRWARTSSSVSKNHAVVADRGEQVVEHVAAHRLEAALGVAEAGAQRRAQDPVVGARDQLALRAADHARAVREPGADRQVAVAGEQRRDQREQPAQVGREVDVHVTDDARVARRPGGAQRAAAALALEPQHRHRRQLARERGRHLGRRVRARVVGDHDPPAERELGRQEAVQAADAERERPLLVVHRHDDLDVGRRSERRRRRGGATAGSQARSWS